MPAAILHYTTVLSCFFCLLFLFAGDSRAVVMADGQVVAHTEEHRAEREDEQVSRHGWSSSSSSSC
jgi:serine/threonine protein phosphatase PrpC